MADMSSSYVRKNHDDQSNNFQDTAFVTFQFQPFAEQFNNKSLQSNFIRPTSTDKNCGLV